jgi:tetrahydromethanopterin S-methyltransferase subunit G
MTEYSFLQEDFRSKIKKAINADEIGKKLAYIAAGGYAGSTIGGAVGTVYGAKLYMNKDETLVSLEKKIRNPSTSVYTRQKLIDKKNLIQSMTDEEYRSYILTSSYEKGKNIGRNIGTIAAGGLAIL